jgi:hypothetical protein
VTYIGGNRGSPLTADSDQLLLRYDAASNTYEVRIPSTQSWVRILPTTDPNSWASADSAVQLGATPGSSTTLVRWSMTDSFGVMAIAIPTPASAIPRTGTGTYLGSLSGYSSEAVPYQDTSIPGRITGGIDLTFNFATGSLAGSIQPVLTGRVVPRYPLPTLTFTNTIYSVGSTTFSGQFATNVPGVNSFSGLFAGPTAGELAGNFAFPYLSPRNGAVQQASGAFTATKQ